MVGYVTKRHETCVDILRSQSDCNAIRSPIEVHQFSYHQFQTELLNVSRSSSFMPLTLCSSLKYLVLSHHPLLPRKLMVLSLAFPKATIRCIVNEYIFRNITPGFRRRLLLQDHHHPRRQCLQALRSHSHQHRCLRRHRLHRPSHRLPHPPLQHPRLPHYR